MVVAMMWTMDLELPADIQETLEQLDAFIESDIKPLEQQDDNIRFFDHRREYSRTDFENGGVPTADWEELLREMRRRADAAGWLRLALPVEFGGQGASNLKMAIIREHFATKGLGLHNDLQNESSIVGNFPTVLMMRDFGTDEQRAEWMPGFLDGTRRLAFGLTEPNHGSDATYLETTARPDGDEWVINGMKRFKSGLHHATHDIVVARRVTVLYQRGRRLCDRSHDVGQAAGAQPGDPVPARRAAHRGRDAAPADPVHSLVTRPASPHGGHPPRGDVQLPGQPLCLRRRRPRDADVWGCRVQPPHAVRAHLPPPPSVPHHRGLRGDPDAQGRPAAVRLRARLSMAIATELQPDDARAPVSAHRSRAAGRHSTGSLATRTLVGADEIFLEGAMPDFPTITHVALTVSDLDRSVPWYEKLFGTKPVLDEDTGPFRHVVWAVGGTLVGLHQFPDPSAGSFDERRVGLDHLAFACSNRAELQAWESKLNDLGVAHGGVVDASYGSGLSFRDPDNIALEFFAPPG